MKAEPESPLQRDFHFALAAGIVPVLMLPVTIWLALRRDPAAPRARRPLRFVVAIDVVIALGLAVMSAVGATMPEAPKDPPRIGVQLDASYGGKGARIQAVWPGSPAEDGGLANGDVVVEVDGVPVAGWEELTEAISAGEPEAPRLLLVEGENGERTVRRVVPEARLQRETPAFHVQPGKNCSDVWHPENLFALWPAALGVGLVLLAWLVLRIRSPGPGLGWGWVILPLVLAPLGAVATTQGLCVVSGGWSMGAVLLGTLFQGLVLLLGGWVLLRWLGPHLHVVLGPKLSPARAGGRAVFYIVAALARAAVVILVLMALVPGAPSQGGGGVQAVFEGASDPIGKLLVFSAAVVMAPLAEEVIFRGVLLAGLARRMRPGLALMISAVVFGLFHVPSHGVGAVLPGLLGLVFGWARLRTGGLLAPILLHAGNNGLVTLLAWLG